MISEIHIEGMEELERQLKDVAPKESVNILRRTVTRQAAELRKDIRRNAPKRTGTLRKAIKSRRRRGTRTLVEAVVHITKGAGAKFDAWYWHFIEFGTRTRTAKPFIMPAVERARTRFRKMFETEFMSQLQRSLAKKGGKR